MPNIITDQTQSESIGKMRKDIRAIREARYEYERQWLVNIAFLYGRHHFMIDRKPSITSDDRIIWELKDTERKNKTRRTSNYILPLFRSLLSRMMRMKTAIDTEATTNDEKDKSAARVAREVLEDFWQNANRGNIYVSEKYGRGMAKILYRKSIYQLACGRSYLLPYFNPKATGRAYLEDRVIPNSKIGAVEVKVFSPFNVFESYDCMKFYTREFMSVEKIKDMYGEEVKPFKNDDENVEQQLSQILDGQGEEMDNEEQMAYLYTKYCAPTEEYPQGQMVIFTEDKVINEEDAIPEEYSGKLPLFRFDYMDFGFSKYPQSAIEQAVPIQEDLNYTLQRIAEYKKYVAGKLLVPRGAKISSKWNDETGQILQYNNGFKPEYAQGINPPEYYFGEIDRCRRDIEDVMGVHDASLGKAPSGVKSGVGIENLSELDDSQIATVVLNDEAQISAFAETVVEIMQKKYDIKRLIGVTGNNMKAEVNSFVGQDIFGNYRVKITLGSILPINLNERRNFILMMLKSQIITPPQAREMLEFGNMEGIFVNIDEEQEKEEIQKLMKADFNVIAEPWEDHTIRLKTLHDFMKTSTYSELPPEVRSKFLEHEKQHQKFLAAEAQAAARMTGRPEMPPAPAPGQK